MTRRTPKCVHRPARVRHSTSEHAQAPAARLFRPDRRLTRRESAAFSIHAPPHSRCSILPGPTTGEVSVEIVNLQRPINRRFCMEQPNHSRCQIEINRADHVFLTVHARERSVARVPSSQGGLHGMPSKSLRRTAGDRQAAWLTWPPGVVTSAEKSLLHEPGDRLEAAQRAGWVAHRSRMYSRWWRIHRRSPRSAPSRGPPRHVHR